MTDVTGGGIKADNSRALPWAGLALGFGLGGFFDGILLHQILQWHHLLSGVEEARQDLSVLLLADGLFHLLMYLVTAFGLWLMWRARRAFAAAGGDRRLIAHVLLGFGAWHVVDGVLSHWVLGIHRIRMDVADPLLWDVLWLVLFGLLPLIVGWWMRGRSGGARLMSSPLALILAIVVAGGWASLPPPDRSEVVVLFRPDVSEQQAVAAIAAAGGRVLGSDVSGRVWAVKVGDGADPGTLYRHGAVLVSDRLLPLGCFGWTRA